MVQPESLGRIIDEHPFFQDIDAKLRALLIGCAANERFEAGQYVFREGQPADKFYLLRAGMVNVEVDIPGRPPIVIETVLDGEVLGWSWMVEPHRYAFAAKANTLVRALSFDAKCLLRKMEADPALGYEVLRRFVPVMAHRLASARLQMLDLYAPSVIPDKVKAEKKAIVVKAAAASKGRNRAPDARLTAVKTEAEKGKAELKVVKKADKKKSDKKALKKAAVKKKAG
jgi:CRP/FNR family cyclic AMP-dependent transcriptional regulator